MYKLLFQVQQLHILQQSILLRLYLTDLIWQNLYFSNIFFPEKVLLSNKFFPGKSTATTTNNNIINNL
jgi:hypothetical protein